MSGVRRAAGRARWGSAAVVLAALTAALRLSAAPELAAAAGSDGGARKLWVFFRERDAARAKARLADPAALVTRRALERRARRGAGRLASPADLPVDADGARAVAATGARVVVVSRWLNAVSVIATPAESTRIARLPCVAALSPVAARAADRREEPAQLDPAPDAPGSAPPAPPVPSAPHALDYGPSLGQLDQIRVPALHDSGYCGAGVLVGVLDAGFECSHPAFAMTSILAERDFVNGDDNTADEGGEGASGHGTAVLSVLGGYAPGNLIGSAYGASFLLAKTEDRIPEYPAEEDFWVAGVEWAESLGVDVISSSVGYNEFPGAGFYAYADMDGMTAVTTRAAQMAVDRGVVVVNAMGNERGNAWNYMIAPADAEGVISVAAVTAFGTAAGFSSVGPTSDGRLKPDVAALGLGVTGAFAHFGGGQGPYTSNLPGTSFATPLVAGVAALLLEGHPDFTPAQVKAALHATASQSGAPDTSLGHGIVRAYEAMFIAAPLPGACDPALDPRPPGGCVAADTTDTTRVAGALQLHRPGGDLFAPASGDLGWSFDLPEAGRVSARVFDASGRAVATLLDGERAAADGIALPWDGRLAGGADAPSAVYLLRLATPAGTRSARIVLVR